jgi:hypothetical protein
LRRRAATRRKIDHAVWDLRERYGEAAYKIARSSATQPVGFERRRFWRKSRRGCSVSGNRLLPSRD